MSETLFICNYLIHTLSVVFSPSLPLSLCLYSRHGLNMLYCCKLCNCFEVSLCSICAIMICMSVGPYYY